MPSRTKSASVDASQQDVEMVDAATEPVVDDEELKDEEYEKDIAQKIKIVCLFITLSKTSKAEGIIPYLPKIIQNKTKQNIKPQNLKLSKMDHSTPQETNFNPGSLIIKQLPGATDDAASYEFLHEDHTLGNALRWMIMKKYLLLISSSTNLLTLFPVRKLNSAATQSHIPLSQK